MKKRLAALVALILMMGSLPARAGVEYEITSLNVDVRLMKDGSARVTEEFIYDFDGAYNGALREIDVSDVLGLSELKVYADGQLLTQVEALGEEPGCYTAEEEDGLVKLKVYAPGSDEVRRFRYEYRLNGILAVYEDAAQFNYKLVALKVPLEDVRATLTLPEPEGGFTESAWSEVDAYAHGSMHTGQQEVNAAAGQLVYAAGRMEEDSFLEAHVLFPAEWLSGYPEAIGRMGGIREKAREMERALEEEREMEAQRAAEWAAKRERALGALSAVYAALCALICWLALKRYGAKGSPAAAGEEDIALPAAVAQWVYRGHVDTDGLPGTLLELVGLKALAMEHSEDGLCFRLLSAHPELKAPHQQKLLDWLFDGRSQLTIQELSAGDDYERAHAFTTGFEQWKRQVAEDAVEMGYGYGNGGSIAGLRWGALGLGAALVLLALIYGPLWGAATVGVALILLLVGLGQVSLLTERGRRARAALEQWIAGGASGPMGSKSWLRQLPRAVALGQTEPLVAQRAMEPERDMLPEVYAYGYFYHDLREMNGGLRDAARHNASVPDPNASSSASGGSSGGGGGGGSAGAW